MCLNNCFLEMEEKRAPTTLEEEIAELKNTIRGYVVQLNKAIADCDDEKRIFFGGLIKGQNGTLKLLIQQEERQLLAQQQQENRGNFILF